MTFQACIDIGGTFTDCLVSDASGRISLFKSPTTPGQFHRGFIDVLRNAAEGYDLSSRAFMAEVEIIVHGSTVSTNALVERKVVRTAVLLNEGHRDILVLREGPRKGAFEWNIDYPDPYIPQNLTRTIRGRIDVRGREIVPFSRPGRDRRRYSVSQSGRQGDRGRTALVGRQSIARIARS